MFNGKDISIFLRNWEQFTSKYCFSDERKIADLPDYCDAGIATYVDTLTKVAKAEVSTAIASTFEDIGTTGGPIGGSEEVDSVALWGALCKVLLIKFRKDDSEQHRVTVPFLRALVKDKAFRTDAEDVERYVYQYKEISSTLLTDGMHTRFDQMVLFLQGLPESMAGKIYTMAKMDVDDPSSFVKSGRFKEALEMALTINRTSTGIDRLRTLEIDQSELPGEAVNQILVRDKTQMNPAHVPTSASRNEIPLEPPSWEDRMAAIERGLEELRLFQQTAVNTATNNAPATGVGYRSMGPVTQRGRLYQPLPSRSLGGAMAAADQTNGVLPGPATYRGCRWCGVNGHLKYQCTDYGKSISEGIVHFLDSADQKTRLGPLGGDGVVVPLPDSSGLWQKDWVEWERKKTESEMTGGPGRMDPAAGGVVRQLAVRDAREMANGESSSSVSTLTLQPGEIRELVAVVDNEGAVQGWVASAKRDWCLDVAAEHPDVLFRPGRPGRPGDSLAFRGARPGRPGAPGYLDTRLATIGNG